MDDNTESASKTGIISYFLLAPTTIYIVGLLLLLVNCIWLCCNCGRCLCRKSGSGSVKQPYTEVSCSDDEEDPIKNVDE